MKEKEVYGGEDVETGLCASSVPSAPLLIHEEGSSSWTPDLWVISAQACSVCMTQLKVLGEAF